MAFGLNTVHFGEWTNEQDDYFLREVKKFLPVGKLMVKKDISGDYFYTFEKGKRYAVTTIPGYITTASGIMNGGWGKKVANELVGNLKLKDPGWVMKRLLGEV